MDGSDYEVVVGTDGCIIVEAVAFDIFAVLHLDRNISISELSTVGHRVDCDMGTFLQYGLTLV